MSLLLYKVERIIRAWTRIQNSQITLKCEWKYSLYDFQRMGNLVMKHRHICIWWSSLPFHNVLLTLILIIWTVKFYVTHVIPQIRPQGQQFIIVHKTYKLFGRQGSQDPHIQETVFFAWTYNSPLNEKPRTMTDA